MSKATFYEHFANKEECILALFDYAAEEMLEAMAPRRARAGEDSRKRVQAGARAFLECSPRTPRRRRRCSSRSSAPGERGAERRDAILALRRDHDTENPTPRGGRDAAVRLARRRVRDRRRGRRARLAPAAPGPAGELRELEPVIERLIFGLAARRVTDLARRSSATSSPAGAARGWWRGASRSRARSARPSRTRSTGAGRPGLRRPGRARPHARPGPGGPRRATAPAASSPATARATGSSPRCTAPASPTSRPPCSRDDGLRLHDCLDHRRGALRAARQQADARRSATLPALDGRASSSCCPSVRVIVCLGAFAWDAALRLRAARGEPCPRPSRASATAPS